MENVKLICTLKHKKEEVKASFADWAEIQRLIDWSKDHWAIEQTETVAIFYKGKELHYADTLSKLGDKEPILEVKVINFADSNPQSVTAKTMEDVNPHNKPEASVKKTLNEKLKTDGNATVTKKKK